MQQQFKLAVVCMHACMHGRNLSNHLDPGGLQLADQHWMFWWHWYRQWGERRCYGGTALTGHAHFPALRLVVQPGDQPLHHSLGEQIQDGTHLGEGGREVNQPTNISFHYKHLLLVSLFSFQHISPLELSLGLQGELIMCAETVMRWLWLLLDP